MLGFSLLFLLLISASFFSCSLLSVQYPSKAPFGSYPKEEVSVKERMLDGVLTKESSPVRPSRNLLSFISEVQFGNVKASAEDVLFRDPDHFIAGKIHHHYDTWEHILQDYVKKTNEILEHILKGISVCNIFQHFKGHLRGKSYDSATPSKVSFENSKICD